MGSTGWFLLGCVTLLISTYSFYQANHKRSSETEQNRANDTSIQSDVSVTGHNNTTAVVGSNSGTLNVNVGVSLEEHEKRVKLAEQKHREDLKESYGFDQAIFGASKAGIVRSSGAAPQSIAIDWDSAKILDMTSETITVQFPDIIGKIETPNMKLDHLDIGSNVAILQREVGRSLSMFNIMGIRLIAQVIENSNDLVILSVGFRQAQPSK